MRCVSARDMQGGAAAHLSDVTFIGLKRRAFILETAERDFLFGPAGDELDALHASHEHLTGALYLPVQP